MGIAIRFCYEPFLFRTVQTAPLLWKEWREKIHFCESVHTDPSKNRKEVNIHKIKGFEKCIGVMWVKDKRGRYWDLPNIQNLVLQNQSNVSAQKWISSPL